MKVEHSLFSFPFLGALVFWGLFGWQFMAFGYIIVREGWEILIEQFVQPRELKSKLDLLKWCLNDNTGQAKYNIENQKDKSIVHSLKRFEYLITEVVSCCENSKARKNINKIKGIIASTKTTFDQAATDKRIQKPYKDAMTCVSKIESYMNDL